MRQIVQKGHHRLSADLLSDPRKAPAVRNTRLQLLSQVQSTTRSRPYSCRRGTSGEGQRKLSDVPFSPDQRDSSKRNQLRAGTSTRRRTIRWVRRQGPSFVYSDAACMFLLHVMVIFRSFTYGLYGLCDGTRSPSRQGLASNRDVSRKPSLLRGSMHRTGRKAWEMSFLRMYSRGGD